MDAKNKKQVVFLHGGEIFNTYEEYLEFLKSMEYDPYALKEKRWKDGLEEELGEDFEVLMPSMPNKYNAKYKEWTIWFEKVIPYLKDGVVFVGHSLGGAFFAKYLAENNVPVKIKAIYIVAAPFLTKNSKEAAGDFVLPENLENMQNQAEKILIYHSQDDPVVGFEDSEKFAKALPNAKKVDCKDKGHFLQEEFPELVKSIKEA